MKNNQDTISYNRKVGNRIKALREVRGMSRKDLAEAADVSEVFIFDVETGKSGISLYNVEQIASGLGVTVNFLTRDELDITESEIDTLVRNLTETDTATQKKAVRILRAFLEE